MRFFFKIILLNHNAAVHSLGLFDGVSDKLNLIRKDCWKYLTLYVLPRFLLIGSLSQWACWQEYFLLPLWWWSGRLSPGGSVHLEKNLWIIIIVCRRGYTITFGYIVSLLANICTDNSLCASIKVYFLRLGYYCDIWAKKFIFCY